MNTKSRFILLLFVVLTACIITSWITISEDIRYRQRNEVLNYTATAVAKNISDTFYNSTLSIYGLGRLALDHDGYIKDLPSLARDIIKNNPNILSISVLPGGIIRQIEPLEYNSEAIGHNIFKDPESAQDAIVARDSRQLTVTGPYNLIQGGYGIIARLPLYKNGDFWGFVSIVYQFPELIEDLLNLYYSQGILFQIRSQPDVDGDIILGEAKYFPSQQVNAVIEMPNNKWYIALAYKPGFNWILALKIIGALLILLLSAYLYHRIITIFINQKEIIEHNNKLTELQSDYRLAIAKIAHDLRAPMQHILNEIRNNSFSKTLFPSPTHIIEENIRYQLVLIEQLLRDTLDSEKTKHIYPEPGYLHHFLQQIRLQAESLTRAEGNSFCMKLSPDLPAIVQADFFQLQRILMNLLSNAAKFTSKGQVTLSVTCIEAPAKYHRLRFRVLDEGPGIPDKMDRGRHPLSGYGLGLTIVTNLLHQMGSSLEYSYSQQGGSDFHFDLELQIPEEMPDPYRDSNVLDWDGSNLNILLLDPDATSAGALSELLLGYGVETFHATSLTEAHQILRQNTIHLVISELDLPDGNGADLAGSADPSDNNVPILLYASRPAPAELESKFSSILLRPADSAELLALIGVLTESSSR